MPGGQNLPEACGKYVAGIFFSFLQVLGGFLKSTPSLPQAFGCCIESFDAKALCKLEPSMKNTQNPLNTGQLQSLS